MPQLDPTFYVSQLFWLLVTFVALFFVMWKVALPRVSDILANRQNRMEQDLNRADALKNEADEVMTAYEAELANSRAKAHEELRGVQEQAARESAARTDELEAKLSVELADAEQRIGEQRQAALSNISGIATDLATASVERLIGETPDQTAVEQAVGQQGGAA